MSKTVRSLYAPMRKILRETERLSALVSDLSSSDSPRFLEKRAAAVADASASINDAAWKLRAVAAEIAKEKK